MNISNLDTTGSQDEQAVLQTLSKDTLTDNILFDNNLTKEYIDFYMSDKGEKKLKLFDKDDISGLELYCYTKNEEDDKLNRCRGVIFDNDKLVMESFPYTKYYTTSETDKTLLQDKLKNLFNECKFYDSHEGTLLRLYYYNNKWHTSTFDKLNAFQSRWSSKESFGTSLKRAIEREYEINENFRKNIPNGEGNLFERFKLTLDKSKQYMFLVRNNHENRILCKPPCHPTFYHVGTYFNRNLSMTDDINVPYPKQLTFDSFQELYNYVENTVLDINNIEIQGVIIFLPNNLQYKVVSPYYKKCKDIRGNQPSIKYRYLQLRTNNEMKNLLYDLYPDLKHLFDSYEYTLNDITKIIHNAYYTRYIKKQYITLPQDEFRIIKECHFWYTNDRNNRIVTLEKVYEILNQQTPSFLNKLLKNYNNTTNSFYRQDKTNSDTINHHYQDKNTNKPYRNDRTNKYDTVNRSYNQDNTNKNDTSNRTYHHDRTNKYDTINRSYNQDRTNKYDTDNRSYNQDNTNKYDTDNRSYNQDNTNKNDTYNRSYNHNRTNKYDTVNRSYNQDKNDTNNFHNKIFSDTTNKPYRPYRNNNTTFISNQDINNPVVSKQNHNIYNRYKNNYNNKNNNITDLTNFT
jgi:hypothetical protein